MKGQIIFVVEDDPNILMLIATHLEARGYDALTFASSDHVLDQLKRSIPNLIILAFSLPEINGIELLRRIREISEVPIMMVSTKTDVTTKLEALEQGADDYLTKPFGIEELLARVRAIIRRSTTANFSHVTSTYHRGDLVVNLEQYEVIRSGRLVKLSAREWAVLRIFVENVGKVVTHRMLLQQAWGPEYGDEGDYIRTYVTRLRKKLEPNPPRPQYILTERGIGYRLASPQRNAV